MFRHLPLPLALALSVVLAACGDDTPTQPSRPANPSLTPASLATASNTWSRIAPMPFGGFGEAVGVVPNSTGQSIAYAFGGTNSNGQSGAPVRIYNVATNTWTVDNHSIVVGFNTNGVGVIGGKLYFSGGSFYAGEFRSGSTHTYSYDPATKTLTRKADMPLFTADGVSGVIGDKLYVLPGTCSGEGWPSPLFCETEPTRRFFRYNPAANTWGTKASAPHYHRNGVGGVINGKFYVAGGLTVGDVPTTTLDVYDLASNTWKSLAHLPVALNRIAGAALRGQLFVSGVTSSGSRRTYAYNPTTDKWVSKAPPPAWRGGSGAATVFLNGTSRMLVVAGADFEILDVSQLCTP